MDANRRRALAGSVLSCVPGAGHLYFKQWAGASSMFLIDAALLAGVFISDSFILRTLMLIIYALIVFSAICDMRVLSGLKPRSKFKDSKSYIAFLLLTLGVNALPLLWQSQSYGRVGKILWTVTAPVLAVLFFGGVFLIAGK